MTWIIAALIATLILIPIFTITYIIAKEALNLLNDTHTR